ncbi:S24 family peptidase [Pseudomonas sp. JH-2]|uniref:S24 family peptidase n=1 Tax=Pseudomonas sp. JH-2 TaxID=3114998 RepID=UPI002E25AAFD
MLKKHAGKSLNSAAQQRIAQAVADSLAEGGSPAAPSSNVIVGDFSRPVGLVGDEIRIAHYDIRGAMGNGQVPADYMEMLHDVKVSQSHLRKIGVSFEDPNHLKMVYGWGQSMEPTIKHADPLIVDISINQFNGDGIFIFTWQGHLYIKRLQVQDADHFEMISDNKKHKDRSIRMDETYIHARVLLVWNAHLV